MSTLSGICEAGCSRLQIERLNACDNPEFFLSRSVDALPILQEVAQPNLFLLYDVFHMQMTESCPETGTGEINFAHFFRHGCAGVRGLDWLRIQSIGGHTRKSGVDDRLSFRNLRGLRALTTAPSKSKFNLCNKNFEFDWLYTP